MKRILIILLGLLLLGCGGERIEIRKHSESTGEASRRETLDDVRVELGDESAIYCGGCCAKALPGYRYCQRCLNRWMAGRTNAGND